eukprot:CAMPEP_0179425830 /NCGR_PEP_ID=MMETSP0799-20121207/12393_1 /TAXON_ID=46947 /ORGANISM="Geminigera cryophila, Strain CCMP2564" /LENGTH=290 /DNA_ID=CAMNT_0021200499 /DNA_START=27 /DNA_END=899 /DNA_ORIENTATION=+
MRSHYYSAMIAGLAVGAEAFSPCSLAVQVGRLSPGAVCPLLQPTVLRTHGLRDVSLMAKKKGMKKNEANVSEGVDTMPNSADSKMQFPSDSLGSSKPLRVRGLGEADDSDAEIKALKRDTRLEALFVDIPKEALAPAPSKKRGDQATEKDGDAAFGLSGDTVRMVKTGTWACCVLLILTLVVVRSPLMGSFRPDDSVEFAKKEERAALDRQGKLLPGYRPFPSLQATPEEVAAKTEEGSNVRFVPDVDKSKEDGVVFNIGNGQRIKLLKKTIKKAAPPAAAPVAAPVAQE